jgi:Epoxide hydrolase N terminus
MPILINCLTDGPPLCGAPSDHAAGQPASAAGDTSIRPFQVHISEAALVDLRHRIAETRWLDRETVTDRSQGNQLAKLQEIFHYWSTDYNWRRLRRD